MVEHMHLISDLDGTWIHPCAPSAQLQTLENHLKDRPGITLTFATGRSLDSALALLEKHIQYWPNHLITDVGTALYHKTSSGAWEEDLSYAAWVTQRWQVEFLKLVSSQWMIKGLRYQLDVKPLRRIALEVLPRHSIARAKRSLEQNLARLGAQVDVLSTGRCIDILPKGINKGSAAKFLHQRFELPNPVIACGDSENDLALFSVVDTAIVMPDGPLNTRPKRPQIRNALIPHTTGPAGILQALRSVAQNHTRLS